MPAIFAAIFEQVGGPAFQARHGLTAEQYQQTFNQLVAQGFRPTCVSGYRGGGQDRYAAIFEQVGGSAFQARHGLTAGQYQQTFDQLNGLGFRPRLVNVATHPPNRSGSGGSLTSFYRLVRWGGVGGSNAFERGQMLIPALVRIREKSAPGFVIRAHIAYPHGRGGSRSQSSWLGTLVNEPGENTAFE